MTPSSTVNSPSRARMWAVVPCAGSGSRLGADRPKQYLLLAGEPVVLHTLRALSGVRGLHGGVVVVPPDDVHMGQLALENPKEFAIFSISDCGGRERAISVLNGLKILSDSGADDDDWVLVHDAARCLVTAQQVQALVDACQKDPVGGLLAQPLADTLKDALPPHTPGEGARVRTTVPRLGKWLAQTPQMFRLGMLKAALAQAGPQVTDEASAIEATGMQPMLVSAVGPNFKITYPEDLTLAEHILAARAPASPPKLRVGEGWDIHALVPGRPLVLGGVRIPFDKGLDGHSDADALLHAITDAILGAAGLGDIGRHFPDTDMRFKGADSRVLLREAAARVRAAGFQISNVDSTVIAQAPKLAPYIGAMCQSIAEDLGVTLDQVNVKAKTAEKMDSVGEGRAMEARAMALLCCVKPPAGI